MVGRTRSRTRTSFNNYECKGNRRSLQKKNYKEEVSTQSENSDDDDDEDFEPLKKFVRKSSGKEKGKIDASNEIVSSSAAKGASKENKNLNEFSWQASKPKLSESESSDEELCPKEAELKSIVKTKAESSKSKEHKEPRGRKNQVVVGNESKEKKSKGGCDENAATSVKKAADAEIVKSQVKNLTIKSGLMKSASPEISIKVERIESVDTKILYEKNSRVKKNLKKAKTIDSQTIEKDGEGTGDEETTPQKNDKRKSRSVSRNEAKVKAKKDEETEKKTREESLKGKKKNVKASKPDKIGKTMGRNSTKKNERKDRIVVESLPGPSKIKNETDENDSDDSENEWEDVNEAALGKTSHESPRKKAKLDSGVKDISINLKVKSIHGKSQNKKEKFLQCVERRMRKFQNEQQMNLHKCHLVCLVARLQWINNICNDNVVKAVCLSLVPSSFSMVKNAKWNLLHLKRFVNWFRSGSPETAAFIDTCRKISEKFKKVTRLQSFVAALRSIGFVTRFMMSCQPITWKVEASELFKLKKDDKKEAKEENVRSKSPVKHLEEDLEIKSKGKGEGHGKSCESSKKLKAGKVTSPYFEEETVSEIKKDLEENEKNTKKIDKHHGNKSSKRKSAKNIKANVSKVSKNKKSDLNANTPRLSATRKRKLINYKETDIEATERSSEEGSEAYDVDEGGDDVDDEEEDDDDFMDTPKRSLSSKLSEKAQGRSGKRERKSCMPSVDRGYARKLVKTINDEAKFEKTSKPVKRRRSLNDIKHSPTVKIISSDSESCHSKDLTSERMRSSSNIDCWCEVYLQSDKRWVCVDIITGTVDDVTKLEMQASQPLQYVLGIDNASAIKDVTCRYASKFMSKTRKLRIDREWWAETLHPYETKQKKLDNEEDSQLRLSLMQQPFPKTLSEFKSHPLYVLEGDLLKFEGIYPEQPAVLGYFRNKAIYSRECVHILHTRENWLKEARVVKQGETAYKIVKGRPKRNTPIHERDNVKIDLFGSWQTEVYKPPPIVNGKVPRNEYGNVELFQPSMIPPGGVHIPIQGIHKTARKLGIDAAPAMMGWDFHGGFAHPVIEGVVVAAEFEEKLLDAWQKEEDEREKKSKEKNEKKIFDRWKLLVKGLIVRERIRRKYDFRESEDFEHIVHNEEQVSKDMSVSWPLNKLEGTTSINDRGHCHVFPESSHKKDKITGEWKKSCSCGLSLPFEKL